MATSHSSTSTGRSFVACMDNYTPSNYGENGHLQYGWSHQLEERIVQLSFQLVRTTVTGQQQLAATLDTIIREINGLQSIEARTEYLDVVRRLILNTRDLEDGKGEWALGYALLRVYYTHYPDEALKMIKYFVKALPEDVVDGKPVHPYGSWKDIKSLWAVFGGVKAPKKFMDFLIKLSNDEIRADASSRNPSLAARWLPRAKGAKNSATPYKPFFEALALDYFSNYLETAKSADSMVKARRKAFTDYRKLLAKINTVLDTTQIKQCAGRYSEINYKNVPSVTMRNQTRAFQNKKGKTGDEQRSDADDRVAAAANFSDFVSKAVRGEVSAPKGKRVGINKMIEDMRLLVNKSSTPGNIQPCDSETVTVKDLQWADAGTKIGNLGNFIAMTDLSHSMGGDPLHAAIGLGLRIAEKSQLGRRIMTFSESPEWIKLDGCNTLSDMMTVMTPYEYYGKWGMNTNFDKALNMILDMCVRNKLPAENVANMVLVILSDMQIDAADKESQSETMWNKINRKYAEAGRRAIGVPYKPPHVLFWNLRHTEGFPTLSSEKNCTMFAGFSPALLNSFMEVGMDALKEFTPWSSLKKQLASPRYNLVAFS